MKKSFAALCLSFFVAGFLHAEVFVDETFDDASGKVSVKGALKRANLVVAEPGQGAIGTDTAAHFLDNSAEETGVLEYNVDKAGAFLISFDVLNGLPAADSGYRLIFGMGKADESKSVKLGPAANRAFSVELEQVASKGLSLRSGAVAAHKSAYDGTALQQVKIWVNDKDTTKLSYIRPDTKVAAQLNPDSVVIWINDKLIGDELDSGFAMQATVSKGDAELGRLGFVSKSTDTTDFWIDNMHVESVSP
ncbi:MAG: hypothetical protein WCG03_08120 [Kiritimatiellales bacterium]